MKTRIFIFIKIIEFSSPPNINFDQIKITKIKAKKIELH